MNRLTPESFDYCPDDVEFPSQDRLGEESDSYRDQYGDKLVCVYAHRPITRAQVQQEIERCQGINMRVRQAE